jgi:AraC-like DNA-binding protein
MTASADQSLPVKQAIKSWHETMAAWQARTLQTYIASHLHSAIRVMDLVRTVQLPPNRFFRLFKKRFGLTPHQYVMRARIARAQRLLLLSEDTLEKIAAECGFCNKSRLANLFRNATGQPPGQWRRIHATSPGIRPLRPFTQKRDISARTVLLDRLARPRSISESRAFANYAKADRVYEAEVSAPLANQSAPNPARS